MALEPASSWLHLVCSSQRQRHAITATIVAAVIMHCPHRLELDVQDKHAPHMTPDLYTVRVIVLVSLVSMNATAYEQHPTSSVVSPSDGGMSQQRKGSSHR